MESKLKILLLEDLATDAELEIHALQKGGIECVSQRVDTEQDFRRQVREFVPDVILSDFSLPGFDGLLALEIATAICPDTPYLFVSGTIGEERAIDSLKRGATDYVLKSNLNRLPSAVVRALQQTRERTARERVEQALRASEERFRAINDTAPIGICLIDVEGGLNYANATLLRMSGAAMEQLAGAGWRDSIHPEDRERVSREWVSASGSHTPFISMSRLLCHDASIVWVRITAAAMRDGETLLGYVCAIENITEPKQLQERLVRLAHYDTLTELPNRVLFHDRLKQALSQAQRKQRAVAVMFVDLDRFKNVNDTLGHGIGDKLLQQVSARLMHCLRTGDTVGRMGGDEFALVLSELVQGQDSGLVAQKIIDAIGEPFELDGHEVFVTASVGIATYPGDSTDADALVKNADAAMYRAKEMGRNNYQFYTAAMNERALEKMRLESDLRHALERNEFLLHFQPKVSLVTREITGFEALLRWQIPGGRLVPPVEFIPLLEESGLIVPVGEWVLQAACAQIKALQQAGANPVPIAVNLSAKQFRQQDVYAVVKQALAASKVDPKLLELEITETAMMENTETSIATLRNVKALGVRVILDDFGTGYSSLSYLKRFPIDCLKIDRAFIIDLTTNPDDASITQAIINMAHSLKLTVVAEGVETEAQLAFLTSNGCDEMQGYYYSRPLPAAECTELFKQGRKLPHPTHAGHEGQHTLLLVDDEENVLFALKRVLRQDGYRILTATSAKAAFEILAQHQVGVIVSDQRMPGTNGIEFLSRVRTIYPETMRMVLSGYTDLKTVTEAINEGAIYKFLTKPWEDNLLRATIAEAFRRCEVKRENERPQTENSATAFEMVRINRKSQA